MAQAYALAPHILANTLRSVCQEYPGVAPQQIRSTFLKTFEWLAEEDYDAAFLQIAWDELQTMERT